MLTDKDTNTLSGANIEEYLLSPSASLLVRLEPSEFSIFGLSSFLEVSQ